MGDRGKISNIQYFALIALIMGGVGILSLPNQVATLAGNDGWILIVKSALVTILIGYIMIRLTRMYPEKTIYEFGKEIVNPYVFNIMVLGVLVYYVLFLAFEIRIFGEVIRTFLLPFTPVEVVIATMLLCSAYLARSGIQSIARISIIIVPIAFLIILILFLFLLPTLDYTNIFPIFRTKITDLIKHTKESFFVYAGFETILVVSAYLDKPKHSFKYFTASILFALANYLLFFFINITRYGSKELKRQIWPSLSVIRQIDFKGAFVENLDGIFLAIWLVVIFGTIGPIMYSMTLGLKSLFKTKTFKFFTPFLIPIIYVVSLIPEDLDRVYEQLSTFINYGGILYLIVFPILFFLISYFKNKRRQS